MSFSWDRIIERLKGFLHSHATDGGMVSKGLRDFCLSRFSKY